ncbi:MAG: sigma 54-interacting transcriptional regulator, partial [Gemmatimonadetes bacterium]|nr:sigma 54-interacting transcriptional regulator [Gemmatimonadota bacterium]
IHVDVRFVAATNRDLKELMEQGGFREDLFYRLNVFRIELPALREHRADIPLLVEHALEQMPRRTGATLRPVCSPFAMRLLQAHDWPGNVRELFAALESACIRSGGHRIEVQHLPAEIRGALGSVSGAGGPLRYRNTDDGLSERAAIVAALEQAEGVRSRAAELLGMGRTTLWRKLKQYGLAGADEEG